MNIVFMGGNKAGRFGLHVLYALIEKPRQVISYDSEMDELCTRLSIQVNTSILDISSVDYPYDLLISVHGREIVPREILSKFKYGGINVHPCLYAYKGKDPVGRLLADGNTKASVGVHRMTEKVDEGEVLVEEFVDVTGCKTREEVYNKLYPYYAISLIKAMRMIG